MQRVCCWLCLLFIWRVFCLVYGRIHSLDLSLFLPTLLINKVAVIIMILLY